MMAAACTINILINQKKMHNFASHFYQSNIQQYSSLFILKFNNLSLKSSKRVTFFGVGFYSLFFLGQNIFRPFHFIPI